MGIRIRPVTEPELLAWVTMLELAAGRRATAETLQDAPSMYQLDRTLAAFDGDTMVGGSASDPLELTVPGLATLPAARITLSAVLPMYRRRGVVSALFAHQVRDLRQRGEPLAMFTTTGPGLYRRVGYSPAAVAMEVEIETAYAQLDAEPHSAAQLRLLDGEEIPTTLPEVFERHRRVQPGQVSRTAAFWTMWLLDRPQFRRGEPGDRFALICDDASGTPQGYLTYRLRPGAVRDQPVQTFVVEDLIAVTDEARRMLWAYCLGFGQAALVTAPNVPVDEPAMWMLADPRRLRVVCVRDFLWLRILDIPVALTARRYASPGDMVLDVDDPTCPESAGRYRLQAGGASSCDRTRKDADLALGIEDLSAAYLGGVSFSTLARAGRIEERRHGALARADRLFASRPAPWTVTDW
jgi:predicted acetyltransferase